MYKRARMLVFGALFSLALFPCSAFASSSLSFSPASGSYAVDAIIPVRILVQSTESLAAVEAALEFDPKLISVEVTSVAKDVSWVVTPTVEGSTLHYSGMVKKGAPNQLELMQLSVHALRSGKPELRFTSGASTVAADGTGGNTLGRITQASFDISPKEGFVEGVKPAGEVLGANDVNAIAITSPEIPDESAWYSLHDATMLWVLPKDVTDVKIGLSKKPEDTGYKNVSAGTTTRKITELEEGEWYFHVTPAGGSVKDSAHFRIAIDRAAPVFGTTTEVIRSDMHDPNVTFSVSASDKVSGVAYYEFAIDGGSPTRWTDDGSGVYHFRSSVFGEHDVTIGAYDKAGNRSEMHLKYQVLALDHPTVTLKSEKIPEASPIVAEIRGAAGASAHVVFEGGAVHHEDVIVLDAGGKGTYALKESILPGNYMISVVQMSSNGASSNQPVRIDIEITPSILGYIGRNPAMSIALIPVLLILLVLGGWKLVQRYFGIAVAPKGDSRAPLALPPPNSGMQRMSTIRAVQVAPLEIRKAIKIQAPGAVVDLRRQ